MAFELLTGKPTLRMVEGKDMVRISITFVKLNVENMLLTAVSLTRSFVKHGGVTSAATTGEDCLGLMYLWM